jgi:hypothetical protein
MLNMMFLYKEAKKVAKEDEATERLELKFRPAKAWHTKDGSTITENGVPRDVHHIGTLYSGIYAALASVGATLVEPPCLLSLVRACERCKGLFKAARQSARFCEDCRSSYDRRKEQPGYPQLNRDRAREGMERYRHPEEYGFTKSQNRNGRKKNKPRQQSMPTV